MKRADDALGTGGLLKRILDDLRAEALPLRQSRELILEMVETWKS